ncbi:MAG: 6-phospho-beta-glucosidase [Sporichthyaceae bacterium]
MKVTVVGGGSTYTPELADGIGRLGHLLPVTELVLMDPDLGRLEAVGGVCRRILAAHGSSTVVRATDDLADAAAGATAVLLQIRVGGQGARDRDETWPMSCGCVGQETTGAGGLAKALRTVPVVTAIAERVRTVAPDAWLVNFTNPVGIVTRALLDDGHRVIGLCNVAIGLQRLLAAQLGVEPARVELAHVGLNHLSWELDVALLSADGTARVSVLDRVIAEFGPVLEEELGLPWDLVRELGVLPSYYLRYFYEHDNVVRENRGRPTRAHEVSLLEARLLDLYADPELHHKPALLAERGGAYYSEAAVDLLAGLLGSDGATRSQVVNGRNGGTLPFLPDDAVIETLVEVSTSGAVPLPVPEVPPLYSGLIAHVSAYEALALDAARHGGRHRVFTALLAHPLVGQADEARLLTDLLLENNRPWLPWADSS